MVLTDAALIILFLIFLALLFNIATWLMKIHRELVEIKNYSKSDFEDRRRGMASFG